MIIVLKSQVAGFTKKKIQRGKECRRNINIFLI